ncbi:hypothetical protein FRC03_012562 [Tulasnella sp. 419]|nr:hypothetical protein FRC03_012562 [Tulasnella sp. 419]
MPKAKAHRTSITKHSPSARPSDRRLATPSGKFEHVEIGAMAHASGVEILASIRKDFDPVPAITKKEKLQIKHQAFLERLGSSDAPYSKSHQRREKRKQKEALVTDFADVNAAMDAVVSKDLGETLSEEATSSKPSGVSNKKTVPIIKPGQIGESKDSTLTVAQRKRVLEMERMRHPLILANASYASNPFETIRIHAENTLIKHKPPAKDRQSQAAE